MYFLLAKKNKLLLSNISDPWFLMTHVDPLHSLNTQALPVENTQQF